MSKQIYICQLCRTLVEIIEVLIILVIDQLYSFNSDLFSKVTNPDFLSSQSVHYGIFHVLLDNKNLQPSVIKSHKFLIKSQISN